MGRFAHLGFLPIHRVSSAALGYQLGVACEGCGQGASLARSHRAHRGCFNHRGVPSPAGHTPRIGSNEKTPAGGMKSEPIRYFFENPHRA